MCKKEVKIRLTFLFTTHIYQRSDLVDITEIKYYIYICFHKHVL